MSDPVSQAKKRIKSKKNFFNELGSYVACSVFLIGVNVFTSPFFMWAWWPVGIWGISLVFKAIKLVVNDKTSDWERKAVRKEIENMGYDPDIYEDEELDLEELSRQPVRRGNYRDSDLV